TDGGELSAPDVPALAFSGRVHGTRNAPAAAQVTTPTALAAARCTRRHCASALGDGKYAACACHLKGDGLAFPHLLPWDNQRRCLGALLRMPAVPRRSVSQTRRAGSVPAHDEVGSRDAISPATR